MEFKVGDRVRVKSMWLKTWELGTILRIPGYDADASVRLDCHKTYNSDTDAHSFDFIQMRRTTKLDRILEGIDTTQQNE